MTENNNDFYNEYFSAEKAEETETVAEVEEAVEAPVVEAPAEEEPEQAPTPEEKPAKAKKAPKPVVENEPVVEAVNEKVALFAERNIDWSGVGTLKAGYNLVSKDKADLWLGASRKVRLVTPEELASKVAK